MVYISYMQATRNHMLNLHDAKLIVDHLRKGRIAVLPTETGYMIAADALCVDAVDRVFNLKSRSDANPIHVVVGSLEMARSLVRTTIASERLLERHLPGPLTVICPKRDIVSDRLVAGTGNLGIRIPDSPLTVLISAWANTPLTATSLNVSGAPAQATLDETIRSLNWREHELVLAVEDRALLTFEGPSTVVSFACGEEFEVLRAGPITEAMIAEAVRGMAYEEYSDWG